MSALRKVDTGKQWCYIDLNEFEQQIRLDERNRIYERIKNYKRIIRENDVIIWKNRLYFFKQKIIGILFILATVLIYYSGIFYDPKTQGMDCTFSLITIPIGLFLIFTKDKVFDSHYKTL